MRGGETAREFISRSSCSFPCDPQLTREYHSSTFFYGSISFGKRQPQCDLVCTTVLPPRIELPQPGRHFEKYTQSTTTGDTF